MGTALRVCLGGAEWREVATLAEASAAVRGDIERRGVGASGWYGGAAGEVRNARSALVARVSYNGRVWTPGATPGKAAYEFVGTVLHARLCAECGNHPAAGRDPAPEYCGLCPLSDPGGIIAFVENLAQTWRG